MPLSSFVLRRHFSVAVMLVTVMAGITYRALHAASLTCGIAPVVPAAPSELTRELSDGPASTDRPLLHPVAPCFEPRAVADALLVPAGIIPANQMTPEDVAFAAAVIAMPPPAPPRAQPASPRTRLGISEPWRLFLERIGMTTLIVAGAAIVGSLVMGVVGWRRQRSARVGTDTVWHPKEDLPVLHEVPVNRRSTGPHRAKPAPHSAPPPVDVPETAAAVVTRPEEPSPDPVRLEPDVTFEPRPEFARDLALDGDLDLEGVGEFTLAPVGVRPTPVEFDWAVNQW